MLFVLFISLIFCGNFQFSFGQCDKCGVGGIACIGKNTFQMCLNDKPEPSMGNFTCDGDTVCVSSNPARCVAPPSVASCGANCGLCIASTYSSCINQKKFALCVGTVPSDTLIGDCPIDHVCNSATSNICVPKTSADGATCPAPPETEQPPTIEPPDQPTNPTEFCEAQQNVRFPRKFPDPGNCNRFNYCFIVSSKIEGRQYLCPGKQQFNCNTQSCGQKCVPC